MGLASVTESDFLVIGGGSAGCIDARRLAQRASGRIILLEAGKSAEGGAAATNLARLDEQTEAYDWALGLQLSQAANPNWTMPAPDFWGLC
jgi:choline dehydrogenase-like flavoprotein